MYTIRIPRADLFAKVSFVIFIFFTIFTTSIPFQSTLQESGEVGTTNLISVALFPFLFLLSFIAFIPNIKKIVEIVKNEKFLSIFLLWALFSIGWSAYPDTSFKRWFQIFDYVFISVVFFSYCNSIEEIVKSIKPIVYIYLAVSIIVVFIVPGAKDPRFGSWRGLTAHKNSLGEIAMICVILMSIFYKYETTLINKSISITFLLISIALLIGANSSTAIINFVIFFIISVIFLIQSSLFKRIGVGKFISLFSIVTILITFYLLYTQAPEIIQALDVTGKDVTTLSERTYLWEYIMMEISKHPIIGCGFRGFWVIDSPGILTVWNAFPFLPIQAHSGYLDITNEVGIVGIGLFILIVLYYLKEVKKIPSQSNWVWFIVLPLVGNITETTLFREGSASQVFFTIAYLLPFALKREDNDN
jgi:O-antigen ligase